MDKIMANDSFNVTLKVIYQQGGNNSNVRQLDSYNYNCRDQHNFIDFIESVGQAIREFDESVTEYNKSNFKTGDVSIIRYYCEFKRSDSTVIDSVVLSAKEFSELEELVGAFFSL